MFRILLNDVTKVIENKSTGREYLAEKHNVNNMPKLYCMFNMH